MEQTHIGWKSVVMFLPCRIDSRTKVINFSDNGQLDAFAKKSKIIESFEQLIAKFSDRTIVLSYQSDDKPSKDELLEMFKNNGKKVKVFEKEHRYALSAKRSKELLFVTTN